MHFTIKRATIAALLTGIMAFMAFEFSLGTSSGKQFEVHNIPVSQVARRRLRQPAPCPACQAAAAAKGQPTAKAPQIVNRVPTPAVAEAPVAAAKEPEWKNLFDGKTLEGWKSTAFGGEGEVKVVDGSIVLDTGSDMTGITYTGKLPKSNYELVIEAQRLEGVDFFAATTFPVKESFASMVPGGWAGGVFGISSINGFDASENETTKFRQFEDKRWYKFRIQVTVDHIRVWVDDEEKPSIDLELGDKKITTRGEVDLSKPLGISTWHTKSAIRTIKLRELEK